MSPRISIRLLASQSDQRLVALAGDGHERAFEALVHRYRRPLLRYARRAMRLSESRAEDVLQQSFMQAWIALSRGASVQDVRSWLYRIVHNAAVNAVRSPAEAHGELTQAVQDRAGLARVSNLERAIAMRDALGEVAALPAMQRQAIFLTAVDGQSHEQVAGALGISPGALRGLLYRARTTLRSAAAALTPPPVLAWACSASSSPTSDRLIELSAGGGGAGIAGLIAKGAVVAATAGVVATGAGVLGVSHDRAADRDARASHAQLSAAGSGGSPGSLGLAGQRAAASGAAGRHQFAHSRGERGGGGGRSRSELQARRQTGAGEHRRGEHTSAGGHDTLAAEDGGHRLVSGLSGRDGSGDLRGGGSTSSGGTSGGGGETGSTSGSGGGGVSGSGSGDGGSAGASTDGGSSGATSVGGSGDGGSTDGGSSISSTSGDSSTSVAGTSVPSEPPLSGSDG